MRKTKNEEFSQEVPRFRLLLFVKARVVYRLLFFLVKPFLLKKFTLFGGNHHLWREPSVAFHCFKIRVPPNRRIAFTLNSSFLSKSVNRPRISRHMRLYTEDIDNIVRCPFIPPRTRVRIEAKRIPNMSYNEIRWIVVYTFQCNCAKI